MLASLLGLGVAALIVGCQRDAAPPFQAIDITGADYAHALDLKDTDGHLRHLSDFKGKVTVVFFGYTQCPDVCPTTMLELAEVKKSLGSDGQRVQGIFVTLDPERDTPAVLKAYVANFSPDFIALRGSEAETRAAAKQFKVYYARVPGTTPGSYTMDHTAGTYIFDPEGKVRLFSRYGSGAQALKQDIQLLLGQG